MFQYIKTHWQGNHSLVRSFWVNIVCVNIALAIVDLLLRNLITASEPTNSARVMLAWMVFTILFLYPWQLVGTWRSATKASKQVGIRFWPGAVKVLLALSLAGSIFRLSYEMPLITGTYQLAFQKDEYGDYIVSLISNGERIYLKGGFGRGVARQVERLLIENPNVSEIILSSIGGRLYEARLVSNLILQYELNTYALGYCHSACTVAFISGKERYLANMTKLGFHQYSFLVGGFEEYSDLKDEQALDSELFTRQGVSTAFVERMYQTDSSGLWYPNVEEMSNAGVIFGAIPYSEFISSSEIEKTLSKETRPLTELELYKSIKTHQPEFYYSLAIQHEELMLLRLGFEKSVLELTNYIDQLLLHYLPNVSDGNLLQYVHHVTDNMQKLNAAQPLQCVKYAFPDVYGAADMQYFTKQEIDENAEMVRKIVLDSYQSKDISVDEESAGHVILEVAEELGEELDYVEAIDLTTKEDYTKACNAIIQMYTGILHYEPTIAANTLRYMFSH